MKSKKKTKKIKSKLKTKGKSKTIKKILLVDGQFNDDKSKIWINGEWVDLDESAKQPCNPGILEFKDHQVHAGSSLASLLNEEEKEDKSQQQVGIYQSWVDSFFAIFGFKRKI